jgi:hypothetical protein
MTISQKMTDGQVRTNGTKIQEVVIPRSECECALSSGPPTSAAVAVVGAERMSRDEESAPLLFIGPHMAFSTGGR